MVRDDAGLLVEATSVLINCSSTFKAEIKALERALNHACSIGWSNIIFSTNAAMVVEDTLSDKEPKG